MPLALSARFVTFHENVAKIDITGRYADCNSLYGRNCHAVEHAARHVSFEVGEGVSFVGTGQDEQVEPVLSDGLHAIEHAHEEVLAAGGGLAVEIHHETDGARRALGERAGRLVWRVAKALGGLEDERGGCFR